MNQPENYTSKPAPKVTPMMAQYLRSRPSSRRLCCFTAWAIFYELFFDDAVKAARLLGITLTARRGQWRADHPAGVPYHAAEQYLAKTVATGRIGRDLRTNRRSRHEQRPG